MTDTRPRRDRPIVGVGAVIFNGDGEVLLVRRGKPPLHQEWSIPGGAVELGETLEQAVKREVLEETGLTIRLRGLIDVVDGIIRGDDSEPTHHYVLIDYAADAAIGTARAASDVSEVIWVAPAALDGYPMWSETRRVILLARDAR